MLRDSVGLITNHYVCVQIYSILSMPTAGYRVKRWAEGMEDMTQLP